MAKKAKHAFGAVDRIDESIASGKIDAYDILFVKDENGKPYVGWVDKDGKKVLVSDDAELAELESKLSKKVSAEEVDEKLATKADAEKVEAELSTKASVEEVDSKIKQAVQDIKHPPDSVKYKILDAPIGTLVDYFDKEIRVMCPADAVFAKQSVGTGGDPNCYYVTLKTYAPDDANGYIEHLGNQVDAEILTDLKTDEYGRKYQLTWLGIAKYDEASDSWNYYGKNSTTQKYIGWDYQIDFFDDNGVMIESDCVRINLSNEQCHSTVEPYYVSSINATIDAKIEQIEEKIEEVTTVNEVIEF